MQKILSLSLSCFLFYSCLLSGQVIQIPTGTTKDINEIEVVDGLVVINGRYGFVAKCTDDCDSIIKLNSPALFNRSCQNLNLLDSSRFYVSCDGSQFDEVVIRKTMDGGQTWVTLYDSVNFSLDHLLVFDSVEAVGYGINRNGVRTTDAGISWHNEYHPFFAVTAAERLADSIVAIGTVEKFCISNDRGVSWAYMGFVQAAPADIFFLNKDTIMVASYIRTGNFFSSTFDGGNTWQNYPVPVDPSAIYFLTQDEGYMVGDIFPKEEGLILRTLDGGQNWDTFNTGIKTVLLDLHFLDDSIALITGTNGVLLKFNKNQFYQNLSIEEEIIEGRLADLFPNPTCGMQQLILNVEKTGPLKIILFDIAGRRVKEVFSGQSKNMKQTFDTDFSALPLGVYLYQILIGGEIHYCKAIKS